MSYWHNLPFTPQFNNITGNVFDTLNWILVSGNYIANGNENYLIIGNFKNDLNTDTFLINSNIQYDVSYVYIDDVSLTPCTGIDEFAASSEEFTVYPNPAGEEINVQSSKFKVQGSNEEINIYDMMGKVVLQSQYSIPNTQINISSLQSGMYVIAINGVRKKFVKE